MTVKTREQPSRVSFVLVAFQVSLPVAPKAPVRTIYASRVRMISK